MLTKQGQPGFDLGDGETKSLGFSSPSSPQPNPVRRQKGWMDLNFVLPRLGGPALLSVQNCKYSLELGEGEKTMARAVFAPPSLPLALLPFHGEAVCVARLHVVRFPAKQQYLEPFPP